MSDILVLPEALSLQNIDDGAVIERFDYELDRVLQNIADFNTRPDATREVVLRLKIKPNMDRTFAIIEIDVKAKLQSIKPANSTMHLVTGPGGRIHAVQSNPHQNRIPFNSEETTK